jgi:hypothetical protein
VDTATNNQTAYFLYGAEEGIETIEDLSATNYIWYYHDSDENYYHFIGDTTFTNQQYARDFQTSTLAVRTQCRPMTSLCLTTTDDTDQYIGTDYDFKCSKGFNGTLLSNGATSAANYNSNTHSAGVMAGMSFAHDAKLSTKVGQSDFASFQNPLYFGTWSVGWQVPPSNDTFGNASNWDYD